VKYVILLGEGRNGKSLMLKMLQALFGRENVSSVTRQDMADGTTAVLELNGKLLNIVFDGQATYLKDSGREKSLIAGEPVPIKELYRSAPVTVQTNSLFVEGLQHEPKSNDKSSALQKRIVRFKFPNIYELDHMFERQMLSEDSLGAFLSILLDRYVGEHEVAQRLTPTQQAVELQLEHMYINSKALQFIKFIEETDPMGSASLLGEEMSSLVAQFQSWRIRENDLGTWAEPDVQALFQPLVNTERQSRRVEGKPRKVRIVTSFKSEAHAFIETLKGVDTDEDIEAILAD
jgi:putative DNA primase/helicase